MPFLGDRFGCACGFHTLRTKQYKHSTDPTKSNDRQVHAHAHAPEINQYQTNLDNNR